MSHPVTKPPKHPGLIWVTLKSGEEVLGYWEDITGFKLLGPRAMRDLNCVSPPNRSESALAQAPWAVPLTDGPITHWRPRDEPAGEVKYGLEYKDGGEWYPSNFPASDTIERPEREREASECEYRIVEITTHRRVVDGPNEQENES